MFLFRKTNISYSLIRRPATLLKKRPWHRCFPVNFVKFLRTHFCIEHLWWLLLLFVKIITISEAFSYLNGQIPEQLDKYLMQQLLERIYSGKRCLTILKQGLIQDLNLGGGTNLLQIVPTYPVKE